MFCFEVEGPDVKGRPLVEDYMREEGKVLEERILKGGELADILYQPPLEGTRHQSYGWIDR